MLIGAVCSLSKTMGGGEESVKGVVKESPCLICWCILKIKKREPEALAFDAVFFEFLLINRNGYRFGFREVANRLFGAMRFDEFYEVESCAAHNLVEKKNCFDSPF